MPGFSFSGGFQVDVLLTVDQVAERLQVPKSWLYGRIHARNLPFAHVKVGHYVRFPEAAVRAFVEGATRPAVDQQGGATG
jgi:excisionase family DNA binding protein